MPYDFDLVLMGDDHEGSKLKHDSGVERALDFVMEKESRYFIHMGDAAEAIQVDDKRYTMESQKEPITLCQYRNIEAQYSRAASRCIAWILGNHDLKLWRSGNYIKDFICHNLSIPYGGYSCNITFSDTYGKMFKGHFRHGIGTGLKSNAKDEEQKIANMKATLKSRLKDMAGDCVLMAAG
jgi:hypothetical protein